MSRQNINIGSNGNDGTGDPLRTAFEKINNNFIELYGSDNDINTLDANLDVSTFAITTGVTNGDITVTPNGTGSIKLGAMKFNGTTLSSDDSTVININEGLVVDGTANILGATTLGSTLSVGTSLALATGATVTGIDNGALGSSATLLATQGAIKTYVDSQVTAQDLDFACDDSTTLSIDLDSEVMQFSGDTGITTSASGNTVSIAIDSTVTTLTGSQTLTNKILTNPTINAATMTGAVAIDGVTITDNTIKANASNADLELDGSGSGQTRILANATVAGTLNTADVTTTGNTTVSGSLTTGTFNVGDLNIDASGKITTDTNGDVNIDPAGTGAIVLTGPITHAGTQTTTGQLNVDNLRLDGNVLSATSGSITLTPADGQNVTVGGTNTNLTAAEANFTLLEATTVRADTIQNDTSDGDISISTQGTGNINVNSIKIINLADPASAQDAATKAYVDSVGGGGSITASSSTTFTNKTFDANGTGNSISNIDIADFTSGVFLDEDNMASNSATAIASQQSVKAYVDANSGGSTGDLTFVGSTIISPSNADITLDPAGTGLVRMNTDKISLGTSSGSTSQGADSVAIGKSAGSTSQGQKSVAIGDEAGTTSQSQYTVAIGRQAGNNTQGEYSVAVGAEAGELTQGTDSVAMGRQAGYDQGNQAVHIGAFAGGGTSGGPGTGSIGIGKSAGVNSQSTYAIAIGFEAGVTSQGTNSIAIGKQAGNNDLTDESIAIGTEAGKENSGSSYTTTIGYQAGYTGTGTADRSMALGFKAGYSKLDENCIVLNAHNGELNTVGTSRFYVKPVRSASGNSQPLLRYDEDSGEISFMPHIEINDNLIQAVQTNADLELSGNGTGATKINGKLVISASQADGSSVAIDTTKSVAVLAGNSGSDDNDYTLADGTTAGQIIYLVRGPNSSRGSIHVTFSKFENDGTTASNTRKEIFSQYMSVVPCIWNGTAWCVGQHQN